MKHQPLFLVLLLLGKILFLSGCGSNENTTKTETTKENTTVDKHPETKKLHAADAVGYDGTAIKNNVDKMLDKADESNKKAEELNEK